MVGTHGKHALHTDLAATIRLAGLGESTSWIRGNGGTHEIAVA